MLFNSLIFHRTDAIERKILRWRLSGGLAVQVSTLRAGLIPKVHFSVADNWLQSPSKSMLAIRMFLVV